MELCWALIRRESHWGLEKAGEQIGIGLILTVALFSNITALSKFNVGKWGRFGHPCVVSLKIYLWLCVCVWRGCACLPLYTSVCRCLQRLEEHVRSPGADDTGSCEPPKVSAGNRTQVLCKTKYSKCSWLLSQFFSPILYFWPPHRLFPKWTYSKD